MGTKSLYGRGDSPDILVLFSRMSTGPPGYAVVTPVTGSVATEAGSSTSFKVSCRALSAVTPPARLPVAGFTSPWFNWLDCRLVRPGGAGFQQESTGRPAGGWRNSNCMNPPTGKTFPA